MEEEERDADRRVERSFGDVRHTKNTTTALYEGDYNLLKYIQDYLGCSRGEAMRSAIRAFAAQLSTIDKR